MNYFLEPFMAVYIFLIFFSFLHQMFILCIFNCVERAIEVLDKIKIY
jgi:hypothetical protein